LTTDLDDTVIDAKISNGKCDIFIVTRQGMSIRFDEGDVRPMGRSARGVKGVTLAKDDIVVGMEVLDKNSKATILMVTENGYGKRTPLEEYRTQSRGGVGIITQKTTDKVGLVVGTRSVIDSDEVMLTTDKGQVIRTTCAGISVVGRNTQGVRLINLADGEKVSGLALINDQEGETEGSISKPN
jgi:DNA gyrase subunit A